jgi:hypothetical protein
VFTAFVRTVFFSIKSGKEHEEIPLALCFCSFPGANSSQLLHPEPFTILHSLLTILHSPFSVFSGKIL